MKNVLCFFMMAVILSTIVCSAEAIDASKTGGLPLIEGWHWQYSLLAENQDPTGEETATIKVGENESIEVKVKKISAIIKTVINKVEENENFVLAEISGNLAKKNNQNSEYWFFDKATGKIWLGSDKVKKKFNVKTSGLPEGEPFLILPLKIGQGWGADTETERDDHWYQWYVEAEESITVPAGTFNCLRLAYRTNPDHELIWFCPNVGIIKQEYVHHGSVGNIFMELTSYGLAK